MLRKICGQKWSRGWILAVFVAGVTGCIQDPPDSSGTGHAGSLSQAAHINLKSMATLKALMEHYFQNVFMFGMNDEVVHTGYAPMCHYIWSLAVGVRSSYVGSCCCG